MKLQLLTLTICAALSGAINLSASESMATDAPYSIDETKLVTVTGTVKDEAGLPLVGAYVVEKNTSNGVMTDPDGKFTISVSKDSEIEISFMSYISETVIIKNDTNLNVVLMEDRRLLDEVVVVGYGSQSRKSLTSSISTVKSDVIEG